MSLESIEENAIGSPGSAYDEIMRAGYCPYLRSFDRSDEARIQELLSYNTGLEITEFNIIFEARTRA